MAASSAAQTQRRAPSPTGPQTTLNALGASGPHDQLGKAPPLAPRASGRAWACVPGERILGCISFLHGRRN